MKNALNLPKHSISQSFHTKCHLKRKLCFINICCRFYKPFHNWNWLEFKWRQFISFSMCFYDLFNFKGIFQRLTLRKIASIFDLSPKTHWLQYWNTLTDQLISFEFNLLSVRNGSSCDLFFFQIPLYHKKNPQNTIENLYIKQERNKRILISNKLQLIIQIRQKNMLYTYEISTN